MSEKNLNIYNHRHDFFDYAYIIFILLLAIIIFYHTSHWIAFIILSLQILKIKTIINLFKTLSIIVSIDHNSLTIFDSTIKFTEIKKIEIKHDGKNGLLNKVDIKINSDTKTAHNILQIP